MTRLPFRMNRLSLGVLAAMFEMSSNGDALRMLWWQASIAPGGINDSHAVHWACRE